MAIRPQTINILITVVCCFLFVLIYLYFFNWSTAFSISSSFMEFTSRTKVKPGMFNVRLGWVRGRGSPTQTGSRVVKGPNEA